MSEVKNSLDRLDRAIKRLNSFYLYSAPAIIIKTEIKNIKEICNELYINLLQ